MNFNVSGCSFPNRSDGGHPAESEEKLDGEFPSVCMSVLSHGRPLTFSASLSVAGWSG